MTETPRPEFFAARRPPAWKPFLTGLCLGIVAGAGLLMGGVFVAYNFFYQKSVTAMAEAQELKPAQLRADLDWTLTNVDGTTLDGRSLAGQPLFLHLWRPQCVSCIAEVPGINALFDAFQPRGVAFVSIAIEPGNDLNTAIGLHEVRFPVYTLTEGRLPASFNAHATPTTWIVDSAGFVVYHHTGAVDWDTDEARAFLEHLTTR